MRMYSKIYKICLFLMFLFIFSRVSFCETSSSNYQTKIDEMDRSWFSVLSGSPTSIPLQTNYGFIITEDSKFLANYSKTGQRLWQTNLENKITQISVSEMEFICVLNQKNQVQLVNPSGLVLWKKSLGFAATSKPLFGFDGRIFIVGKNEISCFGINGILKWNLKIETKNSLEPQILNDGSIILFLEKTLNGKTCALRISPFGNLLEEIVFQGIVVNSFSSEQGIILVFSSGEIGMCAIENSSFQKNKNDKITKNLTYSKWLNKEIHCNEFSKCKKISSNKYAIFTPNFELCIINSELGNLEKKIKISEITNNSYIIFETVDDKFIIAQTDELVIYDITGKKIKAFSMPSKSGKYKWDYAIFIDSGFISFLSNDWTINSFKILGTSKEKRSPTLAHYKSTRNFEYTYYLNQSDDKPEKSKFSNEIYKTLKAGNYKSKEIDISNTVLAVLDSYIETKTQININRRFYEFSPIEYSFSDIENVLNLIPFLQSSIFQEKLAQLLSIETDKTMIVKILKTISQCGYDPTNVLLSQIEILVTNTNPKENVVLQNVTDAVYEICRFMGRPAILAKGRQILSGLFYPQYDDSTKNAARNALQKLAQLKM